MSGNEGRNDLPQSTSRFSPVLLIAGLAAIALAVWGAAGGPRLVSAGTLVAVLAIGAVAIAGVALIIRPGSRQRS